MGKCGPMKILLESWTRLKRWFWQQKTRRAGAGGVFVSTGSMRTVAKLSAQKPKTRTGRLSPMDEGQDMMWFRRNQASRAAPERAADVVGR